MEEKNVEIKNVKGIKYLKFVMPKSHGVYLITGCNGCGKTTLLVALNRIGSNDSFQKNLRVGENPSIDQYKSAEFSYFANNEKVTYKRKNKRWVPTPKSSVALREFKYQSSFFLSAYDTNYRYYSHEPIELAQKRIRLKNANDELKNGLNEILTTQKYSNLKYVELKKKGRQARSQRKKRIYVVDAPLEKYSEINFSLGERMLLNALEYISEVQENSMLIIDEIELALHPIAQTKFYEYLRRKAKEKKLTVFISTHSSSLIRHCKDKYYLENEDGNVSVRNNCYSSYILNSISDVEDRTPDFVFFVEDVMARRLLHNLIVKYKAERPEDKERDIRIIPVGGWRETIKLQKNFGSLGILNSNRTQAFLDADVEETIQTIIDKNDKRTDSDNKDLQLFNDNKNNITLLNTTPELGIWMWLRDSPHIFDDFLHEKNINNVKTKELFDQTVREEGDNDERQHAKNCLKNLTEKIEKHTGGTISVDNAYDYLFESYVANLMKTQYKTDFIKIIKMIFGRK